MELTMADGTCSIDGCKRPLSVRGYCDTCYTRLRRHGVLSPLPKETTEQRFWSRVEKTNDCWLWTGGCTAGYGTLCVNSSHVYAHRLAYQMLVGPIPDGMEIDHKCWNTRCVNPDHLEPQSKQKNAENRRGAARNSSTGVRGVSPIADSRSKVKITRYEAKVTTQGRTYWGGRFETVEAAQEAVVALRNRVMTNNLADRSHTL